MTKSVDLFSRTLTILFYFIEVHRHHKIFHELFMLKVYSTVDLSMHLFKLHFKMKLTYKTLPPGDGDGDIEVQGSDTEFSESGGKPDFDAPCKVQWDEDCPWSEWYSAEDPVKGKPSFVID